MANDSFRRCVWLLDTLHRYGRLTLKELRAQWANSPVNDEGKPLPNRTFANYKVNIEQIFGIEIGCDRATNEYYIVNENDLYNNVIRDWVFTPPLWEIY